MCYCRRCRLGASPATGLVGMQENGFLSDFFGCVGFLPLATQRCGMQRCCYALLWRKPSSPKRPEIRMPIVSSAPPEGGSR